VYVGEEYKEDSHCFLMISSSIEEHQTEVSMEIDYAVEAATYKNILL